MLRKMLIDKNINDVLRKELLDAVDDENRERGG